MRNSLFSSWSADGVDEAKEFYLKARALEPDSFLIKRYLEYIDALQRRNNSFQHLPSATNDRRRLLDQPGGKIRLAHRISWSHHRSGWGPALDALSPLHNQGGVLLDTAIETNFGSGHWKDWVNPDQVLEQMKRDGTFDALTTTEEKGVVPYLEPWVGFMHNPHQMPQWFEYQMSPVNIFKKPIWQKSLPNCIGLFNLSEHLAAWTRQQTQKPVSVLFHPTETPEVKFDFSRFMDNQNKQIVQIGFWLRSPSAIKRLPVLKGNNAGYQKVRLVLSEGFIETLHEFEKREMSHCEIGIDSECAANTKDLGPVSNSAYDEMLAQNIVFLHLFDSAATNTVVECIARATPVLINPLPAVIEYLGTDYPLYYGSLKEAAEKALDFNLIKQAHTYLLNCSTKDKITWEYFLNSFKNSEVYKLI
jgi:hypothetical protein